MASRQQLSLAAAVFVNLNIMLGSGIFINSVILTRTAGVLGAVVYPIAGILILPLILVFSHFMAAIPGGTFYELGSVLHPAVGFLSSWGYFVGKLASAALSLHVFVTLMQQIHPLFAQYNPLFCDAVILAIFVFLTLFNVKTGRPIQYGFLAMKMFAVTTVLTASAFLFSGSNFLAGGYQWDAVPACLPFGLFAFAGFEATCSLGKNIENSEKNGPRAIMISYIVVLLALSFYQLGLFGAFGLYLGTLSGFQEPIRLLLINVFPAFGSAAHLWTMGTFVAIASSALGASYSILYSNIWNLHTLARYKTIPAATFFHRCNRYYAPIWCVFAAGFIELLYLFASGGVITPLQQITTFASIFAYTLTALAFVFFAYVQHREYLITALAGILCCVFLLIATIPNAIKFGVVPYAIYGLLLLVGLLGYHMTRKQRTVKQA